MPNDAPATNAHPLDDALREIDPLGALAALIVERRLDRPLVVGLGGSVAVGKSTTAGHLAAALRARDESLAIEVVSTDGFLLPNARLDELGLSIEKGSPRTYDLAALDAFIAAVQRGDTGLVVPAYSHLIYDVAPGTHVVDAPDVVVLEGLNVVTVDRGVVDLVDLSLYLHADPADVLAWFVERFMRLRAEAVGNPSAFFHQFVALDDDDARAFAHWTWTEINLPVFDEHVAPARALADVVIEKGPDHRVTRVSPASG